MSKSNDSSPLNTHTHTLKLDVWFSLTSTVAELQAGTVQTRDVIQTAFSVCTYNFLNQMDRKLAPGDDSGALTDLPRALVPTLVFSGVRKFTSALLKD